MMLIEKLLQPTIDYVFKRIFGYIGNEKITANLLSAILGEKIENVILDCKTILDQNILDDKIGILDVKAKFDDGTLCDIEMQVVEKSNIYKRLLFYWSKLYIQNIEKGEEYDELKKCIVILIADFELEDLSGIPKYITKWEIREHNYGKHLLTDLLEIVIIELPKFNKFKENTDLDIWVNFIKNPEVISMSEEKQNDAVKDAKKVLEEISKDEKERYIAELRLKHIMDQKAIEDRGIEKGLKQGIEQEARKIANKMIEEGFAIETVMKITNLSKEEIENIENN